MYSQQRIKVTNILETVFKLMLFLYALLSTNCFTIQKTVISFVLWPCFALGALLILNRVIHYKSYKTPYMWCLAGLLVAGGISVIANYSYGFKENVFLLILWAFYFLMLYVTPDYKNETDIKKEFKLIGFIYTVCIEICVVISIVMLIFNYGKVWDVKKGELNVGIIYSRLYGVFTDPNLGAMSCCVALFLLIFIIYKTKNIALKITAIVFSILNVFYIALSDSRTAMVMLFVMFFLFSLVLLIKKFKKGVLLKIAAVCLSVLVGLTAFFMPTAFKKCYNGVINLTVTTQKEEDDLTIDRDYDLSGDISNRRFYVWQSGLEIFASSIIYGTGYSGVKDYAKEKLPDTYLVNNDYMEMDTFDNELINILVSNGILGFVCFAAFCIGVVVFVLKRIAKQKEKGITLELVLFVICAGIAAASMFRSAFVYSNTLVANMFWIALAALVTLLKIKDSKGELV